MFVLEEAGDETAIIADTFDDRQDVSSWARRTGTTWKRSSRGTAESL